MLLMTDDTATTSPARGLPWPFSRIEDVPTWEPGVDAAPRWAQVLAAPFAEDEIGLRPQIWCKPCRDHPGVKACGKEMYGEVHEAVKCMDCGQKITTAHLHLSYVGHADVTGRLLEADPLWTWEPMARAVDPEVLKAAIATGSPDIVQMVIDAAPPKLEDLQVPSGVERGMWIYLVLHD